MDPQKQKTELKPEFQEIYERIMNTPMKPGNPSSSAPPAPQPKTQPEETSPVLPSTPEPQPMPYGVPSVPQAPPVPQPTTEPSPLRTSPTTPFVFSSNQTTPKEATGEETSVKKRGILGKALTAILILILLAVYTLFWLFFFKVIDPSILPFSLPF